jgi:hypothetical protein
VSEWPRVSWLDAEAVRVERERDAMHRVAPEFDWTGAGWKGTPPVWPFERAVPDQLDAFLGERRFQLDIVYLESFPMVPPRFLPVDPEPDLRVRTMHAWHVNGDGSLCLFQNTTDWNPWTTAADLLPKASGWFLEYLLLMDDRIEHMTVNGIAGDSSLDHLFVAS